MNRKQRISILAASLLPFLALLAFFVFAPAKVAASSCPFGDIYAPCGVDGCENGVGGCLADGSQDGQYVFCYYDSHHDEGGGIGACTDGCVKCKYGGYQE